jgi:hypothetical protein
MRFLYGVHIPFVIGFLLFVVALAWSGGRSGGKDRDAQ